MFYYPAVLKRHTGCFATIWLVATKGIKITRRDFLKVNVTNTCDDIMNYVLEQVPPPLPGLPRPRFSLYLSSQLQYGVIVVYHRQCVLFLEELQSVVGQLLKQRTAQKIDMDDHSRQPQDLLDILSLMERTEGALDPLFGVMYMQGTLPSPNTLMQMDQEYWGESSPEYPELTSPAAAAADTAAAARVSDITASPETITLRETEPVAMPVTEYEGVDLEEQHLDTIEFLFAQTDDFPEGDGEIPREEVTDEAREVERDRDRDRERDRTKELTGSTIELQPTAISSEDTTLLPQEEPRLSVEKPGRPTDQLTPVSVPVLPSPPTELRERRRPTFETEEVLPPAVKTRRRKRQLVFFDPETQLSHSAQLQQISNPEIETRSPPLLLAPSHRMTPAAELLNNHCNFLPEEVLLLWRQAAIVTPLSGSDLQVGERGPESTDSEKEREPGTVEVGEREQRPALSPKEIPRDVAESEMFDISDHGSLPLEGSDLREVSREISPMYTSEREGSLVSRSASTLQDIPEVRDELQRAASPGLLPELAEHVEAPALFQSLLPPEVDRRTVSNIFLRLLEALSAGRVRVEQNEPYADIFIFPVPGYDVDLNL